MTVAYTSTAVHILKFSFLDAVILAIKSVPYYYYRNSDSRNNMHYGALTKIVTNFTAVSE